MIYITTTAQAPPATTESNIRLCDGTEVFNIRNPSPSRDLHATALKALTTNTRNEAKSIGRRKEWWEF